MAAEKGHREAMYCLGLLYQNKDNNIVESIKWYKMAAGKGHIEAMNCLAFVYENKEEDIA